MTLGLFEGFEKKSLISSSKVLEMVGGHSSSTITFDLDIEPRYLD